MIQQIKNLQDALYIESLVNESLVLKDVVPTIYEYKEEPNESMLFPLAGGTTSIKLPIRLHFSPVNCRLLIFSIEGGLQISQSDTTEAASSGTCTAIDLSHGVDLFTTMLPCVFRFYFIGGNYPDSLKEMFSRPFSIKLTNQNPSPITLEQLSDIPVNIERPTLFKIHSKLTEILCSYAAIYYNSTENPASATQASNAPGYLVIMHELIHNHCEDPYSLDYFENKLGISRYRLCREYSDYYGISPIRDLNNKRILKAKNLLLTSSMQVQEISNSVGFDDVTHFIRLFKRETGHTPGQFRLL